MIYAENILLCIAVPLVLSLFFLRGAVRRFVLSFLAGMGVCLVAAYISGFIDLASGMGESETAIFISPIVEEFMKMLPLLFVLFLFETDDASFLSAAIGVGAGFATFENCCYILSSGAGSLSYILIRGLAVGVMHIVSVLATGFALNLARRFRMLSLAGVAGALSISMIFHALYNLLVSRPGVSSVVGYALPLLAAAALYAGYRTALLKNGD